MADNELISLDSELIPSATLTASVRSLKLLTTLKDTQEQQAKVLAELKASQDAQQKQLEQLTQLAKTEDVAVLASSMIAIANNQQTLVKSVANMEQHLQSEIQNTDGNVNLEISKQIVRGMIQIHEGLQGVSTAMNQVFERMGQVNQNSHQLNDVIAHTNARMDAINLNMNAILDLVTDKTDVQDVTGALNYLSSLNDDLAASDLAKMTNVTITQVSKQAEVAKSANVTEPETAEVTEPTEPTEPESTESTTYQAAKSTESIEDRMASFVQTSAELFPNTKPTTPVKQDLAEFIVTAEQNNESKDGESE